MCLFCDLAKTAIQENDLAYFIYDKYPERPGHTLIIPKRHVETVFDLTPDEWAAIGTLIKNAKSEIEQKYETPKNKILGYNLKVNCGRAAGQEIMHAHIHLIPKY